MTGKQKILWFFLFNLQILNSTSVFAALGGDLKTVEQDRERLVAKVKTATMKEKYLVQEITKPGLTIHEYVSTEGKVFAISWEGIRHPDMKELLGSYAEEVEYTQRGQAKNAGRSSSVVMQSKNVYIQKYGHMRAARGRVILSAMLPDGVDENEIQ
jgi:hypothetical protein